MHSNGCKEGMMDNADWQSISWDENVVVSNAAKEFEDNIINADTAANVLATIMRAGKAKNSSTYTTAQIEGLMKKKRRAETRSRYKYKPSKISDLLALHRVMWNDSATATYRGDDDPFMVASRLKLFAVGKENVENITKSTANLKSERGIQYCFCFPITTNMMLMRLLQNRSLIQRVFRGISLSSGLQLEFVQSPGVILMDGLYKRTPGGGGVILRAITLDASGRASDVMYSFCSSESQ